MDPDQAGAGADRCAGDEQRIELRERLGELQEGIEAAGDMMDDVDASNTAAKRHSDNALAALKAARETLIAAGESSYHGFRPGAPPRHGEWGFARRAARTERRRGDAAHDFLRV